MKLFIFLKTKHLARPIPIYSCCSRQFSKTNKIQNELKLPLFAPGFDPKWTHKICFTDHTQKKFTFDEMAQKSMGIAKELNSLLKFSQDNRVSIMCPQDSTFLTFLWATWMSGQIAVPLSEKHPSNLLEYFLKTTASKVILTTSHYAPKLESLAATVGSQLMVVDPSILINSKLNNLENILSPAHYKDKDALILFTSGTTGLPKGVLLTHLNLEAQTKNICHALGITLEDTLLHTLPLHHTHGLIHALLSPLSIGARCHMLEKFDARQVWSALLSQDEWRPNILMGVPTVYVKLIEEYDKTVASEPNSKIYGHFVRSTCLEKMKIFLSGSASLPVPVLEKWESITGHRILERYGMTETGVMLANPLQGQRRPGFVGTPIQSVEVSVVEMTSQKELAQSDSNETRIFKENLAEDSKIIGDLLVKGPSVFKGYWNNSEATQKEFTAKGWFITGDTVEYDKDQGSFKVLGRKSVDIIKSGGYKLSALEIETQLLGLDVIKEIAIVGLEDPTWGQKVGAIIVWEGKELNLAEFRLLAKTRVAPYACPSVIFTMTELPRNHLGKVNKKELIKLFT